jgi:hypothetical protein
MAKTAQEKREKKSFRELVHEWKDKKSREDSIENPVENGPKHLHFNATPRQWQAWKVLSLPQSDIDWALVQKEKATIDVLYGGGKGGGKLLDMDTPLCTPTGWTTMGDIRVGDFVIGEDGNPVAVVALSDVCADEDAYKLTFSDGTSVVAGARHLWKTMTASDRREELRRDPEWRAKRRASRKSRATGNNLRPHVAIANSRRVHHCLAKPEPGIRTTEEIHRTLRVKHGVIIANHSIANPSPMVLPEVDLLVPPYTLGAWLGDGTSSCATLTGIDAGIWEAIEADGFQVTHSAACSQRHGILGLASKLKAIGVQDNKHIPPQYLRASYTQRLSLLHGLMDTDGWCEKDGSCKISLTRKVLFDGVVELIRSFGIIVNVTYSVRHATNGRPGNASDTWTACFVTDIPAFRLQRKLERQNLCPNKRYGRRFIVHSENLGPRPMRCIQVAHPSGMYLCGRGMIPTHNSHLSTVWAYTYALEVIRHFDLRPEKEVPHIGWMGRKRATDFVATTLQTWQEQVPRACYILKPATGKHPQHILIDDRVAIDYGGLDSRGDIERFNSAEYGFIILDQAEETDQDDVAVLLGSRRKRLRNNRTKEMESLPYRALFTANPRDCWLKRRFVDHADDCHIFVPALYKDNPYLPQSYVHTLEEAFAHRPDLLKAYRDGVWESLSNIDQIILQEWISKAKLRKPEQPYCKKWVSVDPARFGDDACVIIGGENTKIVAGKVLPYCGEPEIVVAAEEVSMALGKAPIIVEEVGVCGVGDYLEKDGFEVIHYCPAGKMSDAGAGLKHANPRSMAWDTVAKWMHAGLFDPQMCGVFELPEPREASVQRIWQKVCEQMTWPKYEFRGQKVYVQPKEDIKKEHNGVSPDFADAYVNGVVHLPLIRMTDAVGGETDIDEHRRLVKKYRRPA